MSRFVILDGGLGTTLPHKHVQQTPLWSANAIIEDPDSVIDAHLAFLRAGATVILTSTYQCSFTTFANAGYTPADATSIMRKSVALAQLARARYAAEQQVSESSIMIALSLGPYGAALAPAQEFMGFYPPPYGPKAYISGRGDPGNSNSFADIKDEERAIEALAQFHFDRLWVFADDPGGVWAGFDCIAFETVPLTREVRAIRKAVGRLWERLGADGVKKPWWISSVFVDGVYPEMDGGARVGVQEVVRAALGNNGSSPVPDGIGINCTSMDHLPRLLTEMERGVQELMYKVEAKLWLVVYPNGGGVYDSVSQTWHPGRGGETAPGMTWAEELGGIMKAREWEGVWGRIVVGGCCETGPDEIRGLCRVLTEEVVAV